MALINEHFLKLQNNYLFSDIAKKVNSFKVTHPKDKIIRMGIGDVTQPLAPAVIEAMHKAAGPPFGPSYLMTTTSPSTILPPFIAAIASSSQSNTLAGPS